MSGLKDIFCNDPGCSFTASSDKISFNLPLDAVCYQVFGTFGCGGIGDEEMDKEFPNWRDE